VVVNAECLALLVEQQSLLRVGFAGKASARAKPVHGQNGQIGAVEAFLAEPLHVTSPLAALLLEHRCALCLLAIPHPLLTAELPQEHAPNH
jgi:hypothetical protein